MSPEARVTRRRALTWSAAVGVPVLVGAAILVPLAASGATDLPVKTPAELLAFASDSDVSALSGTIEQTSELGLPDLGALTQQAASGDPATAAELEDLLSLITGSHTAKVYLDGPSARLQVLDRLGERNVYVDGAAGTAWFVDSESQSATQLDLPDETAEKTAPETAPTPDDMLDRALAALDESTEVSVGTDARVAGRAVYELILTPRTDDTLVGELRFAIDGENGAALAASVTPRGAADPAWQTSFTQVDFAAPDPSVFAFAPGDGFRVEQKSLPADGAGTERPDVQPTVTGEGWASVAELPAAAEMNLDAEQRALLDSLTTAVEGGRVLQTALVSVLLTDDGRVLVGAVPADVLVAAAR